MSWQIIKPLLRRTEFMKSLNIVSRCGVSTSSRHFYPRNPKMERLQKLFQKDDNVPVYLKKGSPDKILAYTTFGLCGLGVTMSLWYSFSCI